MTGATVRARWAGAPGLSKALRRLAVELPEPVLASEHLDAALVEYLVWWIGHADPTGTFAARARWLRSLPARWSLAILRRLGYEGLVYRRDGEMIGHVFYQRRGREVHGFSTALGEEGAAAGASVAMLFDYVAHAERLPGVERVRVGRGRNTVTRRFLERVARLERELGWSVQEGGWIALSGRGPWSGGEARRSREEVFRDIFERNAWGDPETPSGPGSTLLRTSAFRERLPPLFDEFGVRSLLDAGCGDFRWMNELRVPAEGYVGVDIVADLVERNRRRYASPLRRFVHLDVVRDPLPHADAVISRDCLVHFTLAEALAALDNFRRSGARYLLATTFPAVEVNEEVETGGWRPLNLERAPFHLPPALRHIDERRRLPDGSDARKWLGWWRIDRG